MKATFPSAPPRFREEPLAEYYVRLVDVIFAVTLTQTLVIYRNELVSFSPRLLIATLVLVYVTVGLSWVGYHRSIMKYPYNKSLWSGIRVVMDIFILVLYAFLAFAAKESSKVILGLALVFGLYAVDGCTRILEWRDAKVSKPWLSALFGVLFLGVWWLLHSGRVTPIQAVASAFILVVAFRPVRQWLGYPKLLILGVDVDGVLGEQIPALLDRVRAANGLAKELSKGDITEWAFAFDGTDIASEMEKALLDANFVSQMPIVADASAALKALYEHVHIVIATSRPLATQIATEAWLKKNFCFHEVANTRETGKAVLGLEFLIDDNLDNIRTFLATGGFAILFSQPWNGKAETDADLHQFFSENRVVRCSNWKEVTQTVDQFRNTGKLRKVTGGL